MPYHPLIFPPSLSPRVVWSPFVSKHCDHTNLIWCEIPFELNISISLHLYGIMYLHLNRVSYLYLNRCKCHCLNKCSIVLIYHSFKALQLFSWEQLWFLSFIWVWVTFIFLVREWLNHKAMGQSWITNPNIQLLNMVYHITM